MSTKENDILLESLYDNFLEMCPHHPEWQKGTACEQCAELARKQFERMS